MPREDIAYNSRWEIAGVFPKIYAGKDLEESEYKDFDSLDLEDSKKTKDSSD